MRAAQYKKQSRGQIPPNFFHKSTQKILQFGLIIFQPRGTAFKFQNKDHTIRLILPKTVKDHGYFRLIPVMKIMIRILIPVEKHFLMDAHI